MLSSLSHHWGFRFDDDERHLLTENAGCSLEFQSIIPIPRGKALSSVTASCIWHDQGCGNSKGRMGVLLLRGGHNATAAVNEESSIRPPWPLVSQTSGFEREPYSLTRWGMHRIRGRRRVRDQQEARFMVGSRMVEGSEVDLFGVVARRLGPAVRADLDGQSSAEFGEKIVQR